MNPIQLQWALADLEHLDQEVYTHVFMLEGTAGPLWIGSGYRMPIEQVIREAANSTGLPHSTLKVWLGRISDKGQARMSEGLVQDLVKLLVYSRRPLLNKQGKVRYEGRPNLKLQNHGCPLLTAQIRAENGLVFKKNLRTGFLPQGSHISAVYRR